MVTASEGNQRTRQRLITATIVGACVITGAAAIYLFTQASGEFQAALMTIVCGFVALYYKEQKAAERAILGQHFNEKQNALIPLFEVVYQMLENSKATGRRPPSNVKVIRAISDFKPALSIWGSDDLIVAWLKFEKALNHHAEQENPDGAEAALAWDGFVQAMRRDLGHKDTYLPDGAIASLVLRNEERDKVMKS